MKARHTALTFQASPGADSDLLVVTTVDNRFHLFKVESKAAAHWSVDNGQTLPPQLLQRPDFIVGAAFPPVAPVGSIPEAMGDGMNGAGPGGGDRAGNRLMLRSHGFLCFVDLNDKVTTCGTYLRASLKKP